MASRYVSFVIRLLLSDEGKMVWGRIYEVPEQEGQYFRTWEDLIAFLNVRLSGAQDGPVVQPPKDGG